MIADIVVHDSAGNLQLVVEVKNRIGASVEWAATLRRNLLAHNLVPAAPFFMLVLPDNLYLWKQGKSSELTSPDFVAPTQAILRHQEKRSAKSLDNVTEYGLELMVVSWLGMVLDTEIDPDLVPTELTWLYESGLYNAIKHGTIMAGAAVA